MRLCPMGYVWRGFCPGLKTIVSRTLTFLAQLKINLKYINAKMNVKVVPHRGFSTYMHCYECYYLKIL